MNTANIIDLNIDMLEHHPKNPRQDLGDLTELADSIREKGILRNLTVVPNDHGTYYVVIGNRRSGQDGRIGKSAMCHHYDERR